METSEQHNVVHLLYQAAAKRPDRNALVMPGGEALTFRALWDHADRCSTGLAELGFHAGDRAIVMIPMSMELYVVLLGIIKMGGVAVFVDPWIGARRIARFCAFADPRAFVGIPRSHILRIVDRRLLRIPLTISTGRCCAGMPAKVSLQSMCAKSSGNGEGRMAPVSPTTSALITFTTGSSGVPKGANRTHGFLRAQNQALNQEFPIQDDDIDMPMFPVFALRNLAAGITSIIPKMDLRKVADVNPAEIKRQMATHGVVTATASPPFFDKLACYCQENPAQRLSLRRILTGGAPVTDSQLKIWRAAFPETRCEIVYGSTEAEPVAHIALEERLYKDRTRPDGGGYCIGRPTQLLNTRIIQINKKAFEFSGDWTELEVNAGEVGELIVSGDHVCEDYFNNPDAVKRNKIRDKQGWVWHRMGDTVYEDENGYLWLVGRVHSTIIRKQQTIHAQSVEQKLAESFKEIEQVAAIGIPDDETGERLVIVLRGAGFKKSSRDQIKRFLARNKIPADQIIITNKPLPMDPRHNAKIDYSKLRQKLAVKGRKST